MSSGPESERLVRDCPDERYKLVYNEVIRGIRQQQQVLDNVRTRAGILLSAAAITTSFLGAQLVLERGFGHFAWAAVFVFVGVSWICLHLLKPRPGWLFRFRAPVLIEHYVEAEPPLSLDEMWKHLALHGEKHYKKNQSKLDGLHRWLGIGIGLLVLETILWFLDLSAGGWATALLFGAAGSVAAWFVITSIDSRSTGDDARH